MGCGLNKLEKRDDKRPGNIYSTLKRPHVETKIDVSYEYRFLEFTTLSAAELPHSSAVRLTSLKDLPVQLLELYQQGFSLVALHPFLQPTPKQEKSPLEHIFRAILIKKTDKSQKPDLYNDGYILELDCCSSLDHLTDQKLVPEFVKKVQEAASQGLKFVGVIPQFHCLTNSTQDAGDSGKERGRCQVENPGTPDGPPIDTDGNPEPKRDPGGETPCIQQSSRPSKEGGGEGMSKPLDGPNHDQSEVLEEPILGKMEIYTLFNKPKSHQKCRQYYPVTIPLRVSRNGQTVSGLDANWLEHMSDHFRKGGVLVNSIFYLGTVNDSLHSLTDGVFIFEAVSTEDSKTTQGYDAIVVEQWTVLEGVEVQTDYVPLLNSLAAYGWQLTCVLPTPVLRTTREGSVSTKQIIFLQRPCLPQKMKKKGSKFQWRFSREEMHNRQMRKSKSKYLARDKWQAEENEKNLEEPFSKAEGMGNCIAGQTQEDIATEELRGQAGEVQEEKGEDEAMQNGPSGSSGPDCGEEASEGGPVDEAVEPVPEKDN
ncbi:raftlin [Suncus etruscus]|uniref:raftlin n=1 Tax=Suncus etruscus TaxID=109475 RepID=UPI00211083E4|nr:raftlin [Suncus etruscus]